MTEVIYGSSGDVREELNAGAAPGDNEYKGESQIKGAIITRGLRRATRIINGKLEATYPGKIPFAAGDIPALIETIASDLAVCYTRRSKHPGPAPMSDDAKANYCDAPMDLLKEIADREIELPELTGAVNYPETFHSQEGHTPIFDVDSVLDQEVDPDRLDDIANGRD